MTVGALAVPEPVAHRSRPAFQALVLMTAHALELGVGPFERIVGELCVCERLDRKRLGGMAGVTTAVGRAEPELPCVHVPVAAGAVARRSTVRRPSTAQPILFRRAMAAVAGRLGVGTGQRPGAVVDFGRIPATLGMAMRTAPIPHLDGELVAVRVVVAIDAALRFQLEIVSRPLCAVATGAGYRLMPPHEGELGPAVLLHGEPRRPESVLVVARRAVSVS